ncbi:unnamed protein product [Arctia plantaginis]|uniref:CCHC-type domain-containing protein n=1 Tax=Arctia plantaginis TaxID=874455 RepID=A0A8S1ATI1_ARCPL|nr:unnamed protein product [Arctia plantaginis]
MNESEDPFEAHINNLIRCGDTVTKVDKLNYLLLSLPQSYSYIVDIIDALPEHEKSVEYVKSKLLLEQKKRETDRGNGQTFNTRTEKRKCYKCGKTGHLQYNCRSVGGDTGWRTNHSRHPLALRGQEQGQYNGRGQYRGRGQQRGQGHRGSWRGMAGTSLVQQERINTFNVEVMQAAAAYGGSGEDRHELVWLLDSGCSDHIVNTDDYFCESKKLSNPVDIKVGDGFALKSNKIGSIVIDFSINDGSFKCPENDDKELATFKRLDAKAQGVIVGRLGNTAMLHVQNCETAKEIWDKLNVIYEQKSDVSLHILQQRFFEERYNSSEDVSIFIAKVEAIATQIKQAKGEIAENMIVTKIISSLDSGASEHMCFTVYRFINYKKLLVPKDVVIGGGTIIQALGYGDIDLEAYDGEKWIKTLISSVLYVPSLKTNLFSMSATLDKG